MKSGDLCNRCHKPLVQYASDCHHPTSATQFSMALGETALDFILSAGCHCVGGRCENCYPKQALADLRNLIDVVNRLKGISEEAAQIVGGVVIGENRSAVIPKPSRP